MKKILVTGANKGIGLAIVEAILREQPQYSVLLGARDIRRGHAARESLMDIRPQWGDRVEVLQLDVASDESVAQAARTVTAGGDSGLYAVVNNAGIAAGSLRDVLNVNVYGIHRVCENFIPLLGEDGRVVNITSASGPKFVSQCSSEWQRFFANSDITWDQLDQFMMDCMELTPEEFREKGLDDGNAYGLSKACANTCTMYLAGAHPDLRINACTPGFIETDLALRFIGNRTPEEAGMEKPEEGTRAPMFLLFAEPRGSGRYYGSDALRSPLDRYRAPGSPPYTGD